MTIEVKAKVQYFPVVLFIMRNTVIGTFHFLSAPPLWKAFFVLSSIALSESVIFASMGGGGGSE